MGCGSTDPAGGARDNNRLTARFLHGYHPVQVLLPKNMTFIHTIPGFNPWSGSSSKRGSEHLGNP